MYTCTVTPRFGDVDGLRHITNTRLPEWFEGARTPIYRLFQPDLSFDHWDLILAALSIDFHAQMYLGKDIEIRTWLKRVGNSSFTTYHEAWQDGVLGASGEAVIVRYEFAEKRPLPIPEEIRAALQEHLRPESCES
ncbi:MAG: thioesterase family protein [Armatimonadota bacterium]